MSGDIEFPKARESLQEGRVRLVNELEDLGLGDAGDLSYDPNFADTSQVTTERGEAELLAAELLATLEEFDSALGRLDAGSYGVCERCDKAITGDRLAAMPFARLCIACASVVE